MSGPQPRRGVMDMPAYVGGREKVEGVAEPIKLSANENPLGASPQAVAAMQQYGDLAIYPDGHANALRDRLAALNNIDAAKIVCGNGSDDILNLLTQGYLAPGDEAIHTEHGFLVYMLATGAAGGVPVCVSETALTANVDAILAALTDKTRLVFLANPNNPTGTMLDQSEIDRLHAGLPDSVILVLDGAYAEYVDPAHYPAGFDMVDKFDNVVTTRTFSKAYGLAALRVGWGYCPPAIASVLNRLRGPFNVNGLALAAAEAALDDQAHIEKSRAYNAQWRDWLVQQLGDIGFDIRASDANFILVEFDNQNEAEAAEDYMSRHGIIPRGLVAYGLPHALRLSIGTEAANRQAFELLKAFKAQA